MSLYCFTNRRRAKDSIMLIADKYGVDEVTVFIREELVYVNIGDVNGDVERVGFNLVMHYAELCTGKLEDFLRLDEITELYKDEGIRKFRV